MDEIKIKLAKHCIGLDRKKPYKRHRRYFYKPYRNYTMLVMKMSSLGQDCGNKDMRQKERKTGMVDVCFG